MSVGITEPSVGERYRRAVEAIVWSLKTNAATQNRINRWPKLGEAIPPDMEPSTRDVPAVRIEIAPGGPARRLSTEGGCIYPATVIVRTWTRGPGGAAAEELWARIESALEPPGLDDREEFDRRLELAGVWSLRLARAGLPESARLGAAVVECEGRFTLEIWED